LTRFGGRAKWSNFLGDNCQKAKLSLSAFDGTSKGVKIKNLGQDFWWNNAGNREDFVKFGKALVRLPGIIPGEE
jgi:hypothetical protein